MLVRHGVAKSSICLHDSHFLAIIAGLVFHFFPKRLYIIEIAHLVSRDIGHLELILKGGVIRTKDRKGAFH